MPIVKVIATEPHDGHRPGSVYTCSDSRAKELIGKGLVKIKGPAANKMIATTPSNKKSPISAAGGNAKSSASRAAPASQQKTVKPSAGGDSKPKTEE